MDASPPPPANEKQRNETALGITVAAGAFGALLVAGWFGEPVRLGIGLAVAVVGGLIAGAVAGTTRDTRAYAAGTAMIAAIGITLAVRLYVADRSSVYNLELLLPAAVGGLPGLASHYALRRFVPEMRVRAFASLGLAAVALLIAKLVAPAAVEMPVVAAEDVASAKHTLVTDGERNDLRNLLGDASTRGFLQKADMVHSLVQIFGPSGIARAGASGQKSLDDLEKGLAAMRTEADRRIAAGEPASKYQVLDTVENRVRAFVAASRVKPGSSAP